MSKEKLTVENTVNKIQLKVFINTAELYSPHKQGEKELKNLLEQIRDELNEERFELYNTPLQDSPCVVYESDIENVFNKYLNGKGAK